MRKTLRKIRLSAVLAGLMCAAILAPTVMMSVHLMTACRKDHPDCSDRPLAPHQSHQCPVCLVADAVIGKSLCSAPMVVCGALMPVLFFNAERSEAVGGLYPHTKISRAPPLA